MIFFLTADMRRIVYNGSDVLSARRSAAGRKCVF